MTLCDPIDGSPRGSPVPGILQARTLEWVAISFSNAWKWKWSRSVVSDSSQPHGLQPTRPSVHGIFQARVLEWGAIAFSKLFTKYIQKIYLENNKQNTFTLEFTLEFFHYILDMVEYGMSFWI